MISGLADRLEEASGQNLPFFKRALTLVTAFSKTKNIMNTAVSHLTILHKLCIMLCVRHRENFLESFLEAWSTDF